MERIYSEPLRLGSPLFADQFIERQPLPSLQSAPEVVGVNEVAQVLAQLRVIIAIESFDSRFFDGPIHQLDVPVGPRVFDLDQAEFDAMFLANPTEDVLERVPVTAATGQLDTVVGEYRVQGTALITLRRSCPAVILLADGCSSVKVHLDVRSMATNR